MLNLMADSRQKATANATLQSLTPEASAPAATDEQTTPVEASTPAPAAAPATQP
jgi:hypothetical protein